MTESTSFLNRTSVLLAAGTLLLTLPSGLVAQCAVNDECSGAIELTEGVEIDCDVANACVDGPAVTCENADLYPGTIGTVYPDVWFRFVATGGEVFISVSEEGSSFNHWIQVYTACDGQPVQCGSVQEDINGTFRYGQVNFFPVCGTEYFVQYGSDSSSPAADHNLWFFQNPTSGCTSPDACNYDSCAEFDDGSCLFGYGCTDIAACNFDPTAECDDGSCIGFIPNAGLETVCVYDLDEDCVMTDDQYCTAGALGYGQFFFVERKDTITFNTSGLYSMELEYMVAGCTNYGPSATLSVTLNEFEIHNNFAINAENCLFITNPCGLVPTIQRILIPGDELISLNNGSNELIFNWSGDGTINALIVHLTQIGDRMDGCLDPEACNYDPTATCESEICTYPGCREPLACNFNIDAPCNNSALCDYTSCYGCTYPSSPNYNPLATMDDGSCTDINTNECPADLDLSGEVGTADLLFILGAFGTICP